MRNGIEYYKRFRVVGYASRKFKEESDVAAESHVHVTFISPLENDANFQRLDLFQRPMSIVERRVRGWRILAKTMGEAIARLYREDAASAPRANPGVEANAPQVADARAAADASDWAGADDPLAYETD